MKKGGCPDQAHFQAVLFHLSLQRAPDITGSGSVAQIYLQMTYLLS